MRKIILILFVFIINSFLVADLNLFEDPQKAFEENSLKQKFIYDEKLSCLEIKEKILKIESKKEQIKTSNQSYFDWEELRIFQLPSDISNGNKIENFENRLKNLNRLEKIKCKF